MPPTPSPRREFRSQSATRPHRPLRYDRHSSERSCAWKAHALEHDSDHRCKRWQALFPHRHARWTHYHQYSFAMRSKRNRLQDECRRRHRRAANSDRNPQPGRTDRSGMIGTRPNVVAPGKRMLSSMTPTIVAKDGKPYFLIGTPGGRTIINTVLQCVLNVIDFKMNAADAIAAPRIQIAIRNPAAPTAPV